MKVNLYWPGQPFSFPHSARRAFVPNGDFAVEPALASRLLKRYAGNGMVRIPDEGADVPADEVRAQAQSLYVTSHRMAGQGRRGADATGVGRFKRGDEGTQLPTLQERGRRRLTERSEKRSADAAAKKARLKANRDRQLERRTAARPVSQTLRDAVGSLVRGGSKKPAPAPPMPSEVSKILSGEPESTATSTAGNPPANPPDGAEAPNPATAPSV